MPKYVKDSAVHYKITKNGFKRYTEKKTGGLSVPSWALDSKDIDNSAMMKFWRYLEQVIDKRVLYFKFIVPHDFDTVRLSDMRKEIEQYLTLKTMKKYGYGVHPIHISKRKAIWVLDHKLPKTEVPNIRVVAAAIGGASFAKGRPKPPTVASAPGSSRFRATGAPTPTKLGSGVKDFTKDQKTIKNNWNLNASLVTNTINQAKAIQTSSIQPTVGKTMQAGDKHKSSATKIRAVNKQKPAGADDLRKKQLKLNRAFRTPQHTENRLGATANNTLGVKHPFQNKKKTNTVVRKYKQV